MSAPRLTVVLLRAIEEALVFRLAGEIGDEGQPSEDYERAYDWVCARLQKSEKIPAPAPEA